MFLKVTKNHIKAGMPQICDRCPFALAVRAIVKKTVEVKVYESFLYLNKRGKIERISFNNSVKGFIQYFDHGHCPRPRTFQIKQIPKEFLK